MMTLHLTDDAAEKLANIHMDMDAALRYLSGNEIGREHVERWRDELKTAIHDKFVRPRNTAATTTGGGKKKAGAA